MESQEDNMIIEAGSGTVHPSIPKTVPTNDDENDPDDNISLQEEEYDHVGGSQEEEQEGRETIYQQDDRDQNEMKMNSSQKDFMDEFGEDDINGVEIDENEWNAVIDDVHLVPEGI